MTTDLKFALRMFKRRPVVTATIVLTLGLSVGGAGAIFSVIRSVLLNPIAIAAPSRVVLITERNDAGDYQPLPLSHYWQLARSNEQTASFAAFFTTTAAAGREDASRDVTAAFVTADYFEVLGVKPQIGRWFSKADSATGTWTQQVVISQGMWKAQYAGARDVVGKRLVLNGQAMIVVGVMPPSFTGVSMSNVPDLWLAMSAAPSMGLTLIVDGRDLDQRTPVYSVVSRLRKDVGMARFRAVLNTTTAAAMTALAFEPTAAHRPHGDGELFRVREINETAIAGDNKSRVAQILISIAALVAITVLLASINIASILSALSHQRTAEYALRMALGASRYRLYRQVATECALLAIGGAVVGMIVCILALRLVTQFVLPGGVSLDRLNIGVTVPTAGLIIAGALTAMILFGLLPARQAGMAAPIGGLRSLAYRSGGVPVVVLASQVTISLILLVGAALFIRSVAIGLGTDFGFDPTGLVVLSAKSPFAGKHADIVQPYLQMADAIRRVPGIEVAFGSHVPLEGTWKQRTFAGPLGTFRDPRIQPVMMGVETVSDGYFHTLRIPMVSGRIFNAGDIPHAPRVIILNQTAARRLFPGKSPIGNVISAGPSFDYTVVGVVRDTKYLTLNDTAVAFAYVPIMQGDFMGRIRFIAAGNDSRKTMEILRREASEHASALKSMRVGLEKDRLTEALRPQRIGANLMSALALLALCIAALGIYGTVSYTVTRRTAEIGVRRALGAESVHVFGLVMQQCAMALGIGISGGVLGAVLLGNVIAHFLFKVSAMDWMAFAGAVGTMLLVATAAAAAPAQRALRVDAASAIRTG